MIRTGALRVVGVLLSAESAAPLGQEVLRTRVYGLRSPAMRRASLHPYLFGAAPFGAKDKPLTPFGVVGCDSVLRRFAARIASPAPPRTRTYSGRAGGLWAVGNDVVSTWESRGSRI